MYCIMEVCIKLVRAYTKQISQDIIKIKLIITNDGAANTVLRFRSISPIYKWQTFTNAYIVLITVLETYSYGFKQGRFERAP